MGQSNQVKVYMPDEISLSVGPVLIETGFAEDEFIRLEMDSDDATDYAGVDGEVTVTRANDNRGTLTITLQQTADANDGLSVLRGLFKTAPAAAGGIVATYLRDRNGRTLAESANSWILKPPDVTFGKTSGTREWKIRLANVIRFDGGNVGTA